MDWHFERLDTPGAAAARREFAAFVRAHCDGNSDLWASELIFGELLTNALRHATAPIDVYARWTEDDNLRIDVRDCGAPFRYTPHLPEDAFKESGRGLFIVTTLADEFHIVRDEENCTIVTAVLPARKIS